MVALKSVKEHLQSAVTWLMQNGLKNPDNAGAASTDFMERPDALATALSAMA